MRSRRFFALIVTSLNKPLDVQYVLTCPSCLVTESWLAASQQRRVGQVQRRQQAASAADPQVEAWDARQKWSRGMFKTLLDPVEFGICVNLITLAKQRKVRERVVMSIYRLFIDKIMSGEF